MTRKIIAAILTLLTLIGGHFVNRRWDRAIFILGLLTLWGGAVYLYLISLFTDPSDLDSAMEQSITTWKVFAYGVLVIWAWSFVLTVADARKQPGEVSSSISGYFGAVVLSLTIMFSLVFIGLAAVATSEFIDAGGGSEGFSTSSFRFFHETLYFGGGSGRPAPYTIAAPCDGGLE